MSRSRFKSASWPAFFRREDGENLENGGRGNAMAEQIIELRANLQYSCRRMLRHDFIGDLTNERFPIRGRYWGGVRNLFTVISDLVHLRDDKSLADPYFWA